MYSDISPSVHIHTQYTNTNILHSYLRQYAGIDKKEQKDKLDMKHDRI